MSYYSIQEFFNLDGTYSQYSSYHPSQYAQSDGAGTQVIEQGLGEYSIQDSLVQSSANLPITSLQNNLLGMGPQSYLDLVGGSSRTLPVAAPIPVPHAARMKAALRTMLSFGDKDKEDILDNSVAGGELFKITGTRTQLDSDDYVLNPNVQATMDYNALINAGNNWQTTTGRSKLIVRPISPSTLMALTEPCLMAWCTAFDQNLDEPGPSASFPLQNLDYNNCVDTKSNMVCNAWGY